MTPSFVIIIGIVVVALIFDFMNGFHDSANSIATIVSTRVLRPQYAVLWAAAFNFIAFLFFGLHVANTIGKGTVDPSVVDSSVALAALVGAIFWDVITWYYGIPSSSSHALIGGLVGAAVMRSGFACLNYGGLAKIVLSIVLSPLLGFILSFVFMAIISRVLFHSNARRVDRWFRHLQLVSAGLYSLGHGGNDAQKTMGIIAVLLFSTGHLGATFHIPLWIVLACHGAIALGTLCGGWRIVQTMGMKITKLKPVGGFCAETGGALTLFAATALGIPVSTTHTITGSIVGVGTMQRGGAGVRWGLAVRIVWAWVFTIPASALVAAATWWLLRFVPGMHG